LEFDDEDRLLIRCGLGCFEQVVSSGGFTARWSLETLGGLDPGGFLAPDGSLWNELAGAYMSDCVLYVPPTDIPPGYTQQVIVKAQVVDRCAIDSQLDGPNGQADAPECPGGPFEFRFEVNTVRQSDGKYEVLATSRPLRCESPRVNCGGASSPCCDLIGQLRVQQDPEAPVLEATVQVIDYPSGGMCVGETRMLIAKGRDLDRWAVECGHGIPSCPPANVYDFKALCDAFTLMWAIQAPLGQEAGDGVFLFEGQGALFRATKKGAIAVVVTLVDSKGQEVWQDAVEFEIHPLAPKELAFLNHMPVAMDADNGDGNNGVKGSDYLPPHWKDANEDGDAEDTDVAERRYPVAYARKKHVEFDRLELTSKAPLPRVSAVVTGEGPDGMSFTAAVAYDQTRDALVSLAPFSTTTALQDKILAYSPFQVTWRVSFGNDYFSDAGRTDNYLYVLRSETAPAPRYETACYVSCSAASGEVDATMVTQKINAAFDCNDGANGVQRKPFHGNNRVDGVVMGYHVGGPGYVELENLLSSNNGNGACGAWAAFLRSCLQLHGIEATILNVYCPPGSSGFAVNNFTRIRPGSTGNPNYPDNMESDVVDAAGIGGQNNSNPHPYFADHALVTVGNRIYDPSYGNGSYFNSKVAWEDLALWGVRIQNTFAIPHYHWGREQLQGILDLVYN
jgi:hypothetical protein